MTLYKEGSYDKAIQAYDKVIEVDPLYSPAWCFRGYALTELGKYDEAVKSYDKATAINPDYSYAWDGKGLALYKMGSFEEAITCFNKAIDATSSDIIIPDLSAWTNKCASFLALGKENEYIDCSSATVRECDKAIKMNQDDANNWFDKGLALSRLQKYDEAVLAYDKAIKIDPNIADGWIYKAIALYAQGKFDEVLQVLLLLIF